MENYHNAEMGDINHDGFINVSDATLLISYLLSPDSLICPTCSDMNQDGLVNISDATLLISFLLSHE